MSIGLFFFFKQKTAYEMRISDWSSDVCSSDLRCREGDVEVHAGQAPQPESADPAAMVAGELEPQGVAVELQIQHTGRQGTGKATEDGDDVDALVADHHGGAFRSEEHTSELQSLMRISYAVFCLKKNRNTK